MLSFIFGFFAFICLVTEMWLGAVICAFLMILSMSASADERTAERARHNRNRYWAYGEEPDWKRKKQVKSQGYTGGLKRLEDQKTLEAITRQKVEKRQEETKQKNAAESEKKVLYSNVKVPPRSAMDDIMMTNNTHRRIETFQCPQCRNYVRTESREMLNNGKLMRRCECPVCDATIWFGF